MSSLGGRVGPCQTCPARGDELLKVLQTHSLWWVEREEVKRGRRRGERGEEKKGEKKRRGGVERERRGNGGGRRNRGGERGKFKGSCITCASACFSHSPIAHTSTGGPYCVSPTSSSGERYHLVATYSVYSPPGPAESGGGGRTKNRRYREKREKERRRADDERRRRGRRDRMKL